MAYTNAAAGSIADLLAQARPPFAKTIQETDRAAGIVVADHDYFDNLLNTLPDAYQALGRQGIYGDFFSFYLCDLVLKLNGKGGQPVYVKVAGQTHGEVRAAMKPFTERNPFVMGAIGLGLTAGIVLVALEVRQTAVHQPDQGVLGLLRRGRWPDNRCGRAGFGVPGG